MHKNYFSQQRRNEHGQTMVLVAISLVSLLAMAALAIDIVTLYAARSEIQRAADAAALAGAKAIADSSITTLPLSDANFSVVQSWLNNVKDKQIDAMLANNLVAGQTPVRQSAAIDWTRQGNPQLTVSLRVDALPTFFSKIWARGAPSVTATATAEVYNPANSTSITPIAPKSVKPWLVGNSDPITIGNHFVDTTTWAVNSALIGQSMDLVSDCTGTTPPCTLNLNPPQIPAVHSTPQIQYVPASVTPSTLNVCPTSGGACGSSCLGASPYELSIECADVNAYSYLNCGGGATNITWDNSVNPGTLAGDSANGAACLIHANGPGPGPEQDSLNPALWPGGAMQITGGTCSVAHSQIVNTSSSIVTIPIIDTNGPIPQFGGPVTIVGFLQAFINHVDVGGLPPLPFPGSINITVLNIAGCSLTNNGANPVVGGSGSSPIPVRLITPP